MCLEDCFEVKKKKRIVFINDEIAARLPEEKRKHAIQKAESIVNKYVGQDSHALSILGYASERGRFEEFAERLERHHDKNLWYVHPTARKIGGDVAREFFFKCYADLNIGG